MAVKSITVIRVQGKVEGMVYKAKSGHWIAVCDPLKITIQSDTWANLMEDFASTLDAILKDLLSANELEKFLRDLGWKLATPIPRRKENIKFDVPFYTKEAHGSPASLYQ